jgi:hypothetical protein
MTVFDSETLANHRYIMWHVVTVCRLFPSLLHYIFFNIWLNWNYFYYEIWSKHTKLKSSIDTRSSETFKRASEEVSSGRSILRQDSELHNKFHDTFEVHEKQRGTQVEAAYPNSLC